MYDLIKSKKEWFRIHIAITLIPTYIINAIFKKLICICAKDLEHKPTLILFQFEIFIFIYISFTVELHIEM